MKVRTALFVLIAINFVSLLVVGFVATQTVTQLDSAFHFQLSARQVDKQVWKLQGRTYNLLLTSDLATAYQEWKEASKEYVSAHDQLLQSAQNTQIRTASMRIREEKLSNYFNQVKDQLTSIEDTLAKLQQDGFELQGSGLTRRLATAPGFYGVYRLSSLLNTLILFLDDQESMIISDIIDAHGAQLEKLERNRLFMIAGAGIAILLVMVLYVALFARNLYRKISRLGTTLEHLSQGDLTVEIETRGADEIAQIARHIQRHTEELSSVIENVQGSIRESEHLKDTLTATSEQSTAAVHQMTSNIDSIGNQITTLNGRIAATGQSISDIFSRVQDLTGQIEDQSSAVTQSSSAVEEMAASIESVARITTARTEASGRLVSVTETGNEKVAATNEVIKGIAQSVEDIMEIIGIINQIAGQTSILSLNAAIEAAHAGEYGHGFSVVAEEIRSLSDSTNQNAKRIRKSLEEISRNAIKAQELSDESANSFGAVRQEVGSFIDSLKEISATTEELSSGTREMLKSTTTLTQATDRIREAGEGIQSGTRDIDRSMEDVRGISQEVQQAIKEIGVGTREISAGMNELNEISRRTSDQIDLLATTITRFDVSQTESAEPPAEQEFGEPAVEPEGPEEEEAFLLEEEPASHSGWQN